jgi:hypothetical protein
MNKSTPLNQLPSAASSTSFINEQQKQIITNAQAAIQNMNLPQNTQASSDIMNDEDPTIQELLNQINTPQGNHNIHNLQNPNNSIPNHNMQNSHGQGTIPPNILSQMAMQQNIQGFQNDYPGDNYNQQYNVPYLPTLQNTNILHQQPTQQGGVELFMNFFGDDIKIALIVLVVVIIVNFVPISGILGRYIAIDKIPYHDILLKGILAALLVIIIKKIVFK